MKLRGTVSLRLLIMSIAFICSIMIVAIYSLNSNETYTLILMLCIWFYIGWLAFNHEIYAFFTRPTVFIFILINGIRYVLLPFMIIICSQASAMNNITLSGCLLYLYEEVVLCFFMNYILNRVYRKKHFATQNEDVLVQENSYLVYVGFVLLAIVAVIASPSLLEAYNFIFAQNTAYSSLRVSNVINGFWGVAYRIGFLLFPCIVSFCIYKIYARTKAKSAAIVLVAVLLMLTLGFTEGTSRNSALIPAVAAMFLLLRCFPHRKKTIIVFLGVVIVAGFLVMTVTKFAFINSYSGRTMESGLKASIDMIEAYFSGPSNFSISIIAKNDYQTSFSFNTWLSDIFGNWPILSRSFDPYNRTTAFYNIVYYGRSFAYDQIIPATGQGIFHFGYILSIIPVCLSIYISSVFDVKAHSTRDYVKTYVFSYAAVRFAMILITNASIISAFIGSPFIEILLMILVSSRIRPLGGKHAN